MTTAITSSTIYYSKIDDKGRGIRPLPIQMVNTDILQIQWVGEEEWNQIWMHTNTNMNKIEL